MNENKYYIYAYLDPRKPCDSLLFDIFTHEPFYIGKGNGNRFESHLKNYRLVKKTHLSNKINKIKTEGFEPIVIKIYENLTENISFVLERSLINIIGRTNDKTGTLVNITDGGEGVSGLKHSIETRKKLSLKGDKHPNWNKHLSEKTKNKISEKLKLNNPMKNPEISEKVRLKNLGRAPWNKGIKTPEDVCKKLSDAKIKYFNIELISKKNSYIKKFDTIYDVMNFLKKCYRSVYLYLKKGECKDYFIKFEEKY